MKTTLMSGTRKALLATACTIAASGIQPAFAQSTAAAGPQAPEESKAPVGASALGEDIIVTARKRGLERLSDVPTAITAFNGNQLEATFTRDVQTIAFRAPNVQLVPSGAVSGVANFTIRGQGLQSSVPSIDPTVGAFQDGFYLGTTYGVVVDFFDLDGVEVSARSAGDAFREERNWRRYSFQDTSSQRSFSGSGESFVGNWAGSNACRDCRRAPERHRGSQAYGLLQP